MYLIHTKFNVLCTIFIQSSASYIPIKNPSLTSGTESDDSGTAKSSNRVVRFNKVAEVI